MWRTTIVDVCLGPFDCILNVGDCQSIVFEADDDGPWWYSSHKTRESRRNDVTDNNLFKMVNRARTQLADALKDVGNELKGFANKHGVALQYRKVKTIEGWQDKAKGLLQVLWEQGWIDPCKCFSIDKPGTMRNTSFYTLRGKTDHNNGSIDKPSSLRYLMGRCTDFKEEDTAVQHSGSQLGLQVTFTPKFHCKFAEDEGIEYNCVHAKAKMRATPLCETKGRGNLMKLVIKCICPETVLTKAKISKFAARAHA